DIPALADHFLEQFCRDAGRPPARLSAEARRRLEGHGWPGNVRELRNLMERVAYLSTGERVEAADLALSSPGPAAVEDERCGARPWSEAPGPFQRAYIRRAIEGAGRNMSEAAKLLGLHRPNLYRKMTGLEMEPP